MLLENENLIDYETERRFIISPYNKLSFYIPGKGQTINLPLVLSFLRPFFFVHQTKADKHACKLFFLKQRSCLVNEVFRHILRFNTHAAQIVVRTVKNNFHNVFSFRAGRGVHPAASAITILAPSAT